MGAEDGAPTAALGVVSRSEGSWRSLRGGEIDARTELDLRLPRSLVLLHATAPWAAGPNGVPGKASLQGVRWLIFSVMAGNS
jgi:hypothetical protein